MISKPLYLIILLILTSNKLENFPQYLETGCCPRVNCSSQKLPAASAMITKLCLQVLNQRLQQRQNILDYILDSILHSTLHCILH